MQNTNTLSNTVATTKAYVMLTTARKRYNENSNKLVIYTLQQVCASDDEYDCDVQEINVCNIASEMLTKTVRIIHAENIIHTVAVYKHKLTNELFITLEAYNKVVEDTTKMLHLRMQKQMQAQTA